MPADRDYTAEGIYYHAMEAFHEYMRLMKEMHTPDLLYFFPPPPSQPKPEESPPPKRITEKCPKCGMYFQYQPGDKVIHKACKK